jgi:hypothetical protein
MKMLAQMRGSMPLSGRGLQSPPSGRLKSPLPNQDQLDETDEIDEIDEILEV